LSQGAYGGQDMQHACMDMDMDIISQKYQGKRPLVRLNDKEEDVKIKWIVESRFLGYGLN